MPAAKSIIRTTCPPALEPLHPPEPPSFTWTGAPTNASKTARGPLRAVVWPRAGIPSMIRRLNAVMKRWDGTQGPVMHKMVVMGTIVLNYF